jgi:mono/diheme cytochrome c family protein
MGSGTRAGRRGVLLLVALGLVAQPATSGNPRATEVEVTPVEGVSTLHHLGLTIERSSMGWGGQWSPPPSLVPSPGGHAENTARRAFVLSGVDLYRISCRACHKPDGSGSPPEVNSIIGPVQAASFQWMTQRMKAMGRPADPAFIRPLTAGTEADLRKRLKVGGHNMPSFDHLSDAEIVALRPYLDQIAGVPATQRQLRSITEPSARVGELIVKGTCHICHDATGPSNAPSTTVLNDVIPALASMPHQKTFYQFVQKVREGAPIPLSAGGVLSRGRMPVFNYLTEAEVASAYSYLSIYPPK